MDRVTQRRKQGNRLIGQRYLVQTELINNSTGTLYQARDMRASDTETTPVLIHIFPTKALPSTPLKLMTERLQALSAQTDAAVLKVLDSGWINAEAYFVLTSPPSWSLSALPPMLGNPTRMHEQALRLNQRLSEQGLLSGYLPTSLFLVTAHGEVYLPSTALVPNLLSLTESPELLLHAHLLPKRTSISALPWLGLGFISVVAASGAGLYYQNYVMTSNEMLRASHATLISPNQLLESVLATETPPTDKFNNAASLADKPSIELATAKSKTPPETTPPAQLEPFPLPVTANAQPTLATTNSLPALSDPEPGDMRVALASEPKLKTSPEAAQLEAISSKTMPDKNTQLALTAQEPTKTKPTSEKKAESKPESQAEFVEETDPAVNLPSPRNPLIQATKEQPAPNAQFTAPPARPAAVQLVPAPQPQPLTANSPLLGAVNPVSATSAVRIQAPTQERDPETVTANGLTNEELVKKAYQALQAGHLDEQANRGAVYFIRLLDRIDHGNPQILRLARETSYQLHQQARTALLQGDSEQASQKLWRAGRIIKEFNLVQLNPAQELLEHKLAE
ncbi:hypothetical protein [uncultured Thiothrix sp.]|uniref:hypothetical protein n=1 Tax=uncultured Thiothrix sp. TaxID=223185 RepID=UPI0026172E09|nr:hypothetical protein [uncultured Thiothrix sp.]